MPAPIEHVSTSILAIIYFGDDVFAVSVALPHGRVGLRADRDRTCDGLDYAGKLGKCTVARKFDDVPAPFDDGGRNTIVIQGLEARVRSGFIFRHQAAVADHI